MPIDVTIFKPQGLVHVVYRGAISTRDTSAAYEGYLEHPDFCPTQNRLFDLSGITSFTPDPIASLKLHARMIETVMALTHPILMVYLAPTPAARALCRGRLESWSMVDKANASLAETEKAALEILGFSADSLDALYAAAR